MNPSDRPPGGVGLARASLLTQFSMLLASAVVLHALEGLFPPLIPVPGARLGLANIATLVCLFTFGFRSALLLTALRTLLGSMVAGGLLGFGFVLSFGAGIASTVAMGLLRAAGGERFSILGTSLLGAVVHNLAQLSLAALVIRHAGIFAYLPYMLLSSLPTGALTGLTAYYALRARGAALSKWLLTR